MRGMRRKRTVVADPRRLNKRSVDRVKNAVDTVDAVPALKATKTIQFWDCFSGRH